MNRRLELREQADGRVTVDMGAPDFEPLHVPFDTTWLAPRSKTRKRMASRATTCM